MWGKPSVYIHLKNYLQTIGSQKDRGKTASAARILSPNPTRRPLPCLLIQSFFYGHEEVWVLMGFLKKGYIELGF